MTPTINVNLKPCDSGCQTQRPGSKCYAHCAAAPVLIPCPLPRSVNFEVRLGGCYLAGSPLKCTLDAEEHRVGCPARPVKISCSIAGETWEGSKPITFTMPDDSEAPTAVADACRERWALVRALVLGQSPAPIVGLANVTLLSQRDEVFAALCDMARAEEASWRAACAMLPVVKFTSSDMQVHDPSGDAPSRHWLMAYVEHLIDQVGDLP